MYPRRAAIEKQSAEGGIQVVSLPELQQIIQQFQPRGLFLAREGSILIAVDNATGDAWTEEFPSVPRAAAWLRRE